MARVSSVSADDMVVCPTVTGRHRNGSRALISPTNRHVGQRRNRAKYRLLRYNRTGTFHSPTTTHTERCSLQLPHYIPHTYLSFRPSYNSPGMGWHSPPSSTTVATRYLHHIPAHISLYSLADPKPELDRSQPSLHSTRQMKLARAFKHHAVLLSVRY